MNIPVSFLWTQGKSLTFREVDDLTDSLAGWLFDNGVRIGTAVGIFMTHRTEYALAYIAAHKVLYGSILNARNCSVARCRKFVRRRSRVSSTGTIMVMSGSLCAVRKACKISPGVSLHNVNGGFQRFGKFRCSRLRLQGLV